MLRGKSLAQLCEVPSSCATPDFSSGELSSVVAWVGNLSHAVSLQGSAVCYLELYTWNRLSYQTNHEIISLR